MTGPSPDELYTELKPDLAAVAEQLFAISERFIRENGNFLPHGAILTESNDLEFVAAAPETGSDRAVSSEVLPLLHEGLRAQAKEKDAKAVGVAENVTVALEGQSQTKAVKVLVEHSRGLVVAFYLPFERKLLKGFVFGSTFARLAEPEVKPWA